MFSSILLVASAVTLQSADTTLAVQRGMRLDLRNTYGEVHVSTWNRDEIRLASESSSDAVFDVEQNGSVLTVHPARWESRGRRREPRLVALRGDDVYVNVMVTVPAYLDLRLSGRETRFVVNGVQADLTVETVDGGIEVTGGNGFIRLVSQEETIRLTGAQGRIRVSSGEGDVFVRDVQGEITVSAVDGNLDIRGAAVTACEANTVDGDVTYQGMLADDGQYSLSTHDGNVTLMVPSDANATVSVTNYDGVFETAFPVVLRGAQDKVFQFVLGTGRASVELAAFDGDIFLRRADPR